MITCQQFQQRPVQKNLYTRSEEKNIIQWIIENNRHSEIKGIKLWRELEKSNQVPGRTSQSMKERFRKHILPKIQHYQLKKRTSRPF